MKKSIKVPHTYAIIFFVILAAAMLTWVVPGGEFEREVKTINGTERELIVQGSFKPAEKEAQTWQVFSAFYKGFVDKSDIIVFIFMVGGAFMIVTKSRAIDVGIFSFLDFTEKLKKSKVLAKIGVNNIIISLIMLMFSFFGAVFGMSEETIAFVVIFIPLSISMGYDSIVGVSMVFVAAGLGFAGAFLNPFTIGIAQGIAGLPTYSGIEYRIICWLVINFVGIGYVLIYARKIQLNPQSSPVYEEDAYWRKYASLANESVEYYRPKAAWFIYVSVLVSLVIFSVQYTRTTIVIGSSEFTGYVLPLLTVLFALSGWFSLRKSVHFFVLILLTFTIFFLVVGVMGYGWYIMEIATLFFAMGILSGIAMSYTANTIVDFFLEGVRDFASAALVVGLASGILAILQDGKIIDTILNSLASMLNNFGAVASISLMYAFQTVLNLFVPSGSGQAALTMPLMAPLAELIGISKQSAVLAFQFGDGFTNLITPTAGVLIAVLGVARIPYEKWFKWALPFVSLMALVALFLLIPTVLFELPGF